MSRTLLSTLASSFLVACLPPATLPVPTQIVDTKPVADPCKVYARRLGVVREEVLGSIVIGQNVVFVARTANPRVLHRWQVAGPEVDDQPPVVESIVLPPKLDGFALRRRVEFADPSALLFELDHANSSKMFVEVFARGSTVRVHDAPKAEVLAVASHPSGGLIQATVDAGDLHIEAPGGRVTLHEADYPANPWSANLEPFAGGHLLAITIVELDEDVFLLARLDAEGAIVWQRVLGRHPTAVGRQSPNWAADTIGAPVVAVDEERLVVAFGTRTIVVQSLDPDTGATLEQAESELAHDRAGRTVAWVPLAITGAPHDHQIIARSCVHHNQMCGLTSLKWTGGDALPRPLLKLWFDETNFPAMHDWTDHHEARLVLATRKWDEDTTNWWIVDLPDSCEEDRKPGTVTFTADSRLPY